MDTFEWFFPAYEFVHVGFIKIQSKENKNEKKYMFFFVFLDILTFDYFELCSTQ